MSNLQTVQSIYEAFGRGDVPAIIAVQADDVEWERDGRDHGVPWLKPGRGKAHVGSFFQALSAIEISKFDVRNLLEGGNQICAVIDIEITVTATGGKISDEEVHLWTFGTDGKVTSFHHVVDTAQHIAAYKGQPVTA
jgi:ketosteroid isomerase-like protein